MRMTCKFSPTKKIRYNSEQCVVHVVQQGNLLEQLSRIHRHVNGCHGSPHDGLHVSVKALLHYSIHGVPASLGPLADVSSTAFPVMARRRFRTWARVRPHLLLPDVLEPLQDLGRPAPANGLPSNET
jgi:hypothetical protein